MKEMVKKLEDLKCVSYHCVLPRPFRSVPINNNEIIMDRFLDFLMKQFMQLLKDENCQNFHDNIT